MPGDGFVIRPYQPGDEAQILDLFARSFPHAPRSLEHFRWKYLDSPFGNQRISLAFDREGRLVGHYSGYPVPFRQEGTDLMAHQIGDTMTDVAVRHIGRGPTSILGRTALDFYGRFCEGKIAFNYGFNVANIQRFSLRFLRSDRVMPVAFRERTAQSAEGRRSFFRHSLGWRVEIVQDVDDEWDAFFERVAGAYRFCVKRDARYLRWRYLQCPDVRYELVAARRWGRLAGWAAFRRKDNRLMWGDGLVDSKGGAAALEAILRHVAPGGAFVEGWFPSQPSWLDSILQNLGFVVRPEPEDLSVMCVPFVLENAVAKMREEMFYTWGDGDLF